MNGFMVGVIAVIAGIFATILFGRPQGERDRAAAPIVQPVEPATPPSASSTASPSTMLTANVAPIADPWIDHPPTATALTTGSSTIAQLPIRDRPLTAPIGPDQVMPMATPATRAAAMAASGSATTRSMPPFAAIHDPKRPSTPSLQDLSQEIVSLGTGQKLSDVPQLLQYRKHQDPMLRCYVAHAMGQIAAAHTVKSEIQSTIPFLGELAQDPDTAVRQMALRALSRIQSPDVLPYLQKAQAQ
jgi:HEAT repeats